ncbi:MAG: hypothetical protein KC416_04230 [Myxococcales bacterium]|nr:hypothetical protein [Myxococcales bacterium]
MGLPALERKLKGVARATRLPLLQIKGYEILSRGAEDWIFREAEVLSEGRMEGDHYQGSTMITADFTRAEAIFRGPPTVEDLERLAAAARYSVRVHLRAIRLAKAEAYRRFPERHLGEATVAVDVQVRRGKLQIDVDLDIPCPSTNGD